MEPIVVTHAVLIHLSSVPHALDAVGSELGDRAVLMRDRDGLPACDVGVELRGEGHDTVVRRSDADALVVLEDWVQEVYVVDPRWLGAMVLGGAAGVLDLPLDANLPERPLRTDFDTAWLDDQRYREARRELSRACPVALRQERHAVVRLVTEPMTGRGAEVRCRRLGAQHVDLSSGEAAVQGLPEGRRCTLRMDGARRVVAEWVAGWGDLDVVGGGAAVRRQAVGSPFGGRRGVEHRGRRGERRPALLHRAG
ncbi:MAG: hypothetical protein H6734_28410 [Alphaproteobacteria bacterium]|nr:hypothetical protein [Alphaproteobacteria bacterium]